MVLLQRGDSEKKKETLRGPTHRRKPALQQTGTERVALHYKSGLATCPRGLLTPPSDPTSPTSENWTIHEESFIRIGMYVIVHLQSCHRSDFVSAHRLIGKGYHCC